jgi:hypothetical protein
VQPRPRVAAAAAQVGAVRVGRAVTRQVTGRAGPMKSGRAAPRRCCGGIEIGRLGAEKGDKLLDVVRGC